MVVQELKGDSDISNSYDDVSAIDEKNKKSFVKQPTRILIQIINAMPARLVEELSPNSM